MAQPSRHSPRYEIKSLTACQSCSLTTIAIPKRATSRLQAACRWRSAPCCCCSSPDCARQQSQLVSASPIQPVPVCCVLASPHDLRVHSPCTLAGSSKNHVRTGDGGGIVPSQGSRLGGQHCHCRTLCRRSCCRPRLLATTAARPSLLACSYIRGYDPEILNPAE